MKKLVYFILTPLFGKKRYYKFFLILKNIGLQGLNYRNSIIENNGELFLLNKLAKFHQPLPDTVVLFDVGANVGNYSLLLADTFKRDSKIYAFEPTETAYTKLKQLATSKPRIQTFKIGVGKENETLTIYTNQTFSELSGVYNRSKLFEGMLSKPENCTFRTLDSFCAENHIKHIHFLKVDVEGHELYVLQGAQTLLKNINIDFIQFEFGAGNQYSKTYFIDFYSLLEKNYTIYRILQDGFEEITTYSPDYELLLLTNYLAVSKKHVRAFI